jgi:hypothetical protein
MGVFASEEDHLLLQIERGPTTFIQAYSPVRDNLLDLPQIPFPRLVCLAA